MIKVAICDDDNLFAHQLENIILNTCDKESIKVDTEIYLSGFTLEKGILTSQKFDLIYLDIQMENGDGISAAKNIRKMDDNVIIIFVSSYDRYMMELFRLDVFAFIKKPVEPDSFSKTFLEANQKICSKNFFFTFKYRNQEFKIPCKDILYYESRGRQISIHEKSGEVHVFNGKLSDVEKNLEKGKIPFLRIHQSYLVNYFLIRSRTKSEIILINGTILSISEDRQKKFGIDYGKMLRGEINV